MTQLASQPPSATALWQVASGMLSHDTPVSLDLVIGAITLAIAIGGAAAALRALARRMDDTERALCSFRDSVNQHIGNAGLHLDAQQAVQKADCERTRGDLLRQMTAMKEDLLREMAAQREELLTQIALRVENAVMRGIKRANGMAQEGAQRGASL